MMVQDVSIGGIICSPEPPYRTSLYIILGVGRGRGRHGHGRGRYVGWIPGALAKWDPLVPGER